MLVLRRQNNLLGAFVLKLTKYQKWLPKLIKPRINSFC